jgi:hypothetical protein
VGWFYFFCLVGAGKADVRKVILVSRSLRRQALIRVLGYPVVRTYFTIGSISIMIYTTI